MIDCTLYRTQQKPTKINHGLGTPRVVSEELSMLFSPRPLRIRLSRFIGLKNFMSLSQAEFAPSAMIGMFEMFMNFSTKFKNWCVVLNHFHKNLFKDQEMPTLLCLHPITSFMSTISFNDP
jgi:hypothetical protein